jgi:hypothetical protein
MAIVRIFLFLSIVRFALAAPVVVREVHKVHVNVVDVQAEDGTATSLKRWEPWDDRLTNAADSDQTSVPTIPAPRRLQVLQDLDHFPRSSTESNSAPSSPASSIGPHPRSPGESPPPFYWSPPSASSPPESDDFSSTDHSPAPPPNPDRLPPPSLTLTPASSTGPHQSTEDHPPPNSETSLAIPAESVSKSESEDFLDKLLKGKLKRHISGPGAVNSV